VPTAVPVEWGSLILKISTRKTTQKHWTRAVTNSHWILVSRSPSPLRQVEGFVCVRWCGAPQCLRRWFAPPPLCHHQAAGGGVYYRDPPTQRHLTSHPPMGPAPRCRCCWTSPPRGPATSLTAASSTSASCVPPAPPPLPHSLTARRTPDSPLPSLTAAFG